jgi:hypothetical protein
LCFSYTFTLIPQRSTRLFYFFFFLPCHWSFVWLFLVWVLRLLHFYLMTSNTIYTTVYFPISLSRSSYLNVKYPLDTYSAWYPNDEHQSSLKEHLCWS